MNITTGEKIENILTVELLVFISQGTRNVLGSGKATVVWGCVWIYDLELLGLIILWFCVLQ